MADGADLARAMALEPADAADFLRSKRVFLSGGWQTVEAAAHAKGFTVANVTQMDVVGDIQAEMARAQQAGLTPEQFKDNLIPLLKKKGWFAEAGQPVRVPAPGAAPDADTGELPTRKRLTARRLDTIFRVNAQSSYMAARYRELMADVDNRPYFQRVAVMDAKTRPGHRALHGRVWRYDDPMFQSIWAPSGFGCRCRMRALDGADLAERGLQVESSKGRLERVQVTHKDGTTSSAMRYKLPDGQVFQTDPGFDANPAMVQAADRLAIAKAPLILGPKQGQAELRRVFTAKQRLADLENFARTAREARRPMGVKATIGALDEAAALKLADEGVNFDQTLPVQLPDGLVGGVKSARHAAAGDALAVEDWANLPAVLAYGALYWDRVEQHLVWLAEAVAPRGEESLVRLAVRAAPDGNEVVHAALVHPRVLGQKQNGQLRYEVVRPAVERGER